MKAHRLGIALILVVAILPSFATAQVGGILGCSIVPESWGAVQQGLDTIFFGACSQHDLCYRTCNPIGGPYVGYNYKIGCDNNLAIGLSAACTTWSLSLASQMSNGWININSSTNA